ncbi:MAG TPA: zf-HC2 domain-containing protein [Acidobacteriota bacterium]|nr:zf-HC2 domain-containing protein [Acidobacteriota bacterium]
MNCPYVEERLSEYLERSLPADDMSRVAEHLHECANCATLLEEMRSVLATCRSFPKLDFDVNLAERILLRTSGRPRTKTLKERFDEYILRPMLTPRFAAGAVLAALFVALIVGLTAPKMSVVASVLSPKEMFRRLDRSVQQLYSEGLKAYDTKNEWQAKLNYYKNNLFNKLGFMIEQLDVPVEGKKKSGEPRQQQEKAPSKNSSILLLPA